MKYVFVLFLPGAGGNFLSRCLNLLDSAVCFTQWDRHIPQTLEEKQAILNYDSVVNLGFLDRDWKNFESKIRHYSETIGHINIPNNSTSIWYSHYDPKDVKLDLVGKDDTVYTVYIDHAGLFEWTIMNAFYKNSFISVEWIRNAKKMQQDPNAYGIRLDRMLSSTDVFVEDFLKLAAHIGHSVSDDVKIAVEQLHKQWLTTQLPQDKVAEFKRLICFDM